MGVFSNFAGAEDEENIGRGIFGIDISTDLGRKIARACLEEIKRGFKEKYYWERTHIVSEVLKDLCSREDVSINYNKSKNKTKPIIFKVFWMIKLKIHKNYIFFHKL